MNQSPVASLAASIAYLANCPIEGLVGIGTTRSYSDIARDLTVVLVWRAKAEIMIADWNAGRTR